MWTRACSNLRGRYHPLNCPLRCREAQSRAQEQSRFRDNNAPPRSPAPGTRPPIRRDGRSRAEKRKRYESRLSQNKQTFRKRYSAVYSWIDHELKSGPTLAFSLWLSDFKTKTSFRFSIKKTGVVFLFFQKVEK